MLSNLPVHANIAAFDLDRAKRWYAEKLGLTPVFEAEGDTLIYGDGEVLFTIYVSPNAGTAKNTVATWVVPNLPATMAQLRARGVVFEEYDLEDFKTVDGVMTDPDGGKGAWFLDSEGNTLALAQHGASVAGALMAKPTS